MTIEQLDRDVKLLTENIRSMDSIHGSWGEDISNDGTEGDSDHHSVLLLTTGTVGITRTLPSAANNKYRCITYIKIDSGAGTGAISGLGGTWNILYLINQGDTLMLQSDGVVWRVKSGKIQPAATEPDIGGGFHRHYYQYYNNVSKSAGTYTVILTGLPAGTQVAQVAVRGAGGAANGYIQILDMAGNIYAESIVIVAGVPWCACCANVQLGSSFQFQLAFQNANFVTIYGYASLYCLGPA